MMRSSLVFLAVLLAALSLGFRAEAAEVDCLMCHGQMAEGKGVHMAVKMGCVSCHTGVDASDFPHKFAGRKGLSSEPPDLCYTCHPKANFEGSTVHAPVSMGMCTTCHNPHRADAAKLLTAEVPGLCTNCHGTADFEKKNVHAPVMAGMCTDCHAVHANNNDKLLVRRGVLLCRQCHSKVEKEPHMVAGFSMNGHPLRGKKDPKRAGKPFECLSCHIPHSSDNGKLFRYEAQEAFGLCSYCHNF